MVTYQVTMRTHQKAEQTWPWADILNATGYTSAALRRKLQRGLVMVKASEDEFRTNANIWDIAIVRTERQLCDLGFEAGRENGRSFKLASVVIRDAYKDLIGGKEDFNEQTGEEQALLFVVIARPGMTARIIRVQPNSPDEGLREVALAASGAGNVIVPIHSLIRDAWYSLPHLPDHIAAWLRATGANMKKLGMA